MKSYSTYTLKDDCSWRMKTRGKLIRIYGKAKLVKCPNDNCQNIFLLSAEKG